MLNINVIDPKELSLESKFSFRCYPGIACYKSCCKNIDIMLTPFDIVRLRKRFGISSGEFLMKYTYVFIEEKSGYPFVFLNKNDDEEKTCPFLCDAGCSVYEDRPATCRYYPVGQASLKKFDLKDGISDEFYFFVKEEHCLGFNEPKEWTIAEWRKDQGVDLYDEVNRGWKELFFRRNLQPEKLDDRKQKAFYMACYDIDAFRRFVFESRFLDIFDVPAERLEKIKKDEIELMQFGFDYVKFLLMMKETLKMKKS